MTFEQLRYFLAIVDNKTFTAAAEELYISQSSLSKGIKSLEYELGYSLFTRGSKNVELTTAGQIFYNYAKRAEHNRASMLNELAELGNVSKPTEVSIGVLPVIDELNILDYITSFQLNLLSSKTYINLVEGEQDELVKQLCDRKIDAAIVRSDELSQDTFDCRNLLQNELVLICPSSMNILYANDTIDFPELTDFPFIEFDKTSYLNRKIRCVFESKGLIPRYSYTFKRHQQILSMVNAGCGIAIIPEDLIDLDKNPNVRIVHFKEPIYTCTSLVWLRNTPHNDIVMQLSEFFTDPDLLKSETGQI